MAHTQARHAQRGFTLVELMVSLVLFSVAIAGVLSVAVSMSSAFRDQRALVQTESSARSPMDYLADVLRNASPGVQSGAITDGSATIGTICANPQAIIPFNSYSASGADAIEVIYASGAVVTSTRAAFTTAGGNIDVQDATGWGSGDLAVITDTNNGILVKVTGVTPGSPGKLNISAPTCTTNIPGAGYAVGSLVIRAMHARFYVDPSPDGLGIPALMALLDPNAAGSAAQPVTDGIEDLQIATAIESNGTPGIQEGGSAAGDDEWINNVASESLPIWPYAIRSIRLTLIARAVNVNAVGTTVLSFNRGSAEDHAASTTFDNIRRRQLQSTIEIRNLQGSP